MPLTTRQIQEFVTAHAISAGDAPSLARRAMDPCYWRSICPALSIGAERGPAADAPRALDVGEVLDEYAGSGYCACEQVFPADALRSLTSAVFSVQRAGWPMVFAFVFDQLWTILQAPKLDLFLTAILGPSYQTTARFWVNYVPATPASSGFPPHMDGGRDDTVTCWMPLTPAVPDNGCVYVVERAYASKDVLADFKTAEMFTRRQMSLLLAHARALPLNPGGFLAWPHDTIHWGGMFRCGEPRLALSWEFMPRDAPNLDETLPLALLRAQPLPSLTDRLRWICHSISRFEARDMVLARFTPVLREILALSSAP